MAAHAAEPFEMKGLSEAIGLANQQLNTFVGALKEALAPFAQLSDFASHFVQEIDPALVMELGRAFRDLNAVLGSGLRGIVDEARELTRYIGGALLPVMQKLAPIIDELSTRIGQ